MLGLRNSREITFSHPRSKNRTLSNCVESNTPTNHSGQPLELIYSSLHPTPRAQNSLKKMKKKKKRGFFNDVPMYIFLEIKIKRKNKSNLTNLTPEHPHLMPWNPIKIDNQSSTCYVLDQINLHHPKFSHFQTQTMIIQAIKEINQSINSYNHRNS